MANYNSAVDFFQPNLGCCTAERQGKADKFGNLGMRIEHTPTGIYTSNGLIIKGTSRKANDIGLVIQMPMLTEPSCGGGCPGGPETRPGAHQR